VSERRHFPPQFLLTFPAPRFQAKRGQLKRFQGLLPESQGQNRALTVLYVPNSLDSGTRECGSSQIKTRNVHMCSNFLGVWHIPLELPEWRPESWFKSCNLRILVDLVIYDSGQVSLEHLLLSWYPSQVYHPPRKPGAPAFCGLTRALQLKPPWFITASDLRHCLP